MKLIFFGVLLTSLSNLKAQTVANGWIIEDIHGPSQVGIVDSIPVDINQDGKMDVVSASIEDGHLRAYLNQGNYRFEQQYISKEVPGIYRVSATDINNDGLIDFLYPSIETHEITILINQTDHYKKQIIATDVILPTDAQAGDFNQDGLMDVVSISFENNQVFMHLQQPGGTFNTELIPFSGERPRKIQVGDYNDDGLSDFLLASSGDHSVRLYVNLGNNIFSEQLISNEMTGARYVAECDFNHDNLMDFVVAASDDNSVYLFANAGYEIFERKLIDNTLAGVAALHCADIDQDLQTELISVASSSGLIHTHELTGAFNRILIANNRDGYITVAWAQFENNDPPKILTQAHFESRNLLYSSTTANQEQVVWDDFPDGLASIQVDIDSSRSYYYDAFRSGTIFKYSEGVIERLFDGSAGIRALLLAYVNTDNYLDIFSINSETDIAMSHYNDGTGNYNSTVLFNQLLFPTASQAINIQGQQIIVVATTFDEFLWVFDDMGVFSLGSSYSGSFALDVADINGDQLDDIVIADYIGGVINIAIQDIQGEFQMVLVSSNKPRVFSIKAVDMDNDADLDIVSSVNQTDEVWWHENTNMNFSDHLITDEIAAPRDLDIHERMGVKFIAVSSFTHDGGVYLIRTLAGDQFSQQKIHTNLHGTNTLKFIEQPEGVVLLAGGFNNGSLIRLTQTDLIFRDAFE